MRRASTHAAAKSGEDSPSRPAAAGPARELTQVGGNQAIQALLRGGWIKPKLELGGVDDPEEHEADAVADRVMRTPEGLCCASWAGGGSCGNEAIRRQPGESAAGTARHAMPPALEHRVRHLTTGGEVLSPSLRAFFEPRLGRDLSQVRVHHDAAAQSAASAIRARAFTLGGHVGFGAGQWSPESRSGQHLLAHELAHVVSDPTAVRRQPAGMTSASAPASMPAPEPRTTSPVPQAMDDGTVARPPGLPLDGGFQLVPAGDLPPDVVAQIPEGQLTALPAPSVAGPMASSSPPLASVAPPASSSGLAPPVEALGSSAGGILFVTAQQLRAFGFAAAGPDAIGLVQFPLQGTPGHVLPQSRLLWGHTAAYARIGGRITILRSYAPTSLLQTMLNYGGVRSGSSGVPASIYSDVYTPGRGIPMFTHTGARSIEFPVSAEMAQSFAEGLPEVGPASGRLYTGIPSARTGSCGANCVLWAVPEAEAGLGGTFGPVGAGGSTPSVTALGEGGVPGGAPLRASQGRLYQWSGELLEAGRQPGTRTFVGWDNRTGQRIFATVTEEGRVLVNSLPEAAVGSPVLGEMSRAMKVLRWGGRVFFVIGIVTTAAEIGLARPEERQRTAVGAISGFAGGLALGAAAGLVCGPGAPVCSVVLGLGLGILGAYGARSFAELAYDQSHPGGMPITDPIEQQRVLQLAGRPADPCPSCHRDTIGREDRYASLGAFFGPPRSTSLTAAEMAQMRAFLGE